MAKKNQKSSKAIKWVIIVTISTFIATIIITFLSDLLLNDASLLVSLLVLIFIVLFGILSDIVGVAVTAVDIKSFNAMASKKILGAKTAVYLIRHAPRFSSICNDVIGDICGIVSGATGVAITAQLLNYLPQVSTVLITLLMSGCIAAITVGGKALGKDYAMKHSRDIIYLVSRSIAYFLKIFGKQV